MRKIIWISLIVIVLVLGLVIGSFVFRVENTNVGNDGNTANKNNVNNNENEPIKQCDRLENVRKSVQSKTIEEVYCLEEIKKQSDSYEECEMIGVKDLDQNQYYSYYEEGYRFIVKCSCCYELK